MTYIISCKDQGENAHRINKDRYQPHWETTTEHINRHSTHLKLARSHITDISPRRKYIT